MSQHTKQEPSQPVQTGCLSVIVRVTWLLFGNFALALLATLIVRAGTVSALDAVFWGVVSVLVGARYIDVTRLGGLTAEGDPASLRHWRRYSAYLVAASAGLWALAHAAARFVAR